MMISLISLGLAVTYFMDIQYVDAHICLTWEADHNKVVLKCKVDKLVSRVFFYYPSNKEQGHCISPIPSPKCFSSNSIQQDLRTNTTVLIIDRHIDTNINGQWKCVHGRNIDVGVVNITVMPNDTGSCNEENLAWTFIGCLLCGLFVLLRWILKTSCKTDIADEPLRKVIQGMTTCFGGRCRQLKGICFHDCCMFLFCISMLIFLFLLPYTIGIYETQCTDMLAFTIVGFFLPGICLLCFLLRRLSKLPVNLMD